MARYANQKTVVIHIQKPRKDKLFTVIENDTFAEICKLSKSAILVWYYLSGNVEGFKKDFSVADVIDKLHGNISENSVRSGFQELIKTGYIVQEKEGLYSFYQDKDLKKKKEDIWDDANF